MNDPIWTADVFHDWTVLQILQTEEAYAFSRETGRVYKLPHPDCPIVVFKPPAAP